jgi:hypothetical protein
MILVDQPYLWPGTCILTGQGGPESGPEAELEATQLKLQLLEAAVATTLSVGAVFDRKTTKPKLRKAPAGTLLALAEGDDVAA